MRFLVLATFSLLFGAQVSSADTVCNLRKAATLDAKVAGSVHLYLPAEFGARTVRLLLDTGGGWSLIKEKLATNLGLKQTKLRTIYYTDLAGGRITHYVAVPSFKLGAVEFPESDFLVIPDKGDQDIDRWAGTIGAERLSDFDVEIDNTAKTVTLYWPDKYCSGRVVKWTDNVVEIPYRFNNEIPELKVAVNGAKVRAIFDTGSTDTLMDLDLAESAFDVTPETPGVKPQGDDTLISGKKIAFYSYRFKTLTVSGLTFEDVDVTLGDFDQIPLVLGMNEISKLDLYIAFKRKTIYARRISAAGN